MCVWLIVFQVSLCDQEPAALNGSRLHVGLLKLIKKQANQHVLDQFIIYVKESVMH